MKIADAEILIVPGLGNSGPDHWQSRWQDKMRTARRVEQDDWEKPVRDAWVSRLAEAVGEAKRPVILVAHSLGVLAVVHASSQLKTDRVAGAFLVCPPSDAVLATLREIDPAFSPAPAVRLPFPTLVVASSSDPYCQFQEAERMAASWGAHLASAGDAGHVNADSGHGPWPEGMMRFAGFLSTLPK